MAALLEMRGRLTPAEKLRLKALIDQAAEEGRRGDRLDSGDLFGPCAGHAVARYGAARGSALDRRSDGALLGARPSRLLDGDHGRAAHASVAPRGHAVRSSVPGWHTAPRSSPLMPRQIESASSTDASSVTRPMVERVGPGDPRLGSGTSENLGMETGLGERSMRSAQGTGRHCRLRRWGGVLHARRDSTAAQYNCGGRGADPEPWQLGLLEQVESLKPLALLLWAMGTLVLLVALGLGLLRLWRLAREAHPLDEATWGSFVERARRKVGLRRFVDVRSTPAVSMPLAAGVRRPFVLLPKSAARWSAERQELVMLHELVHVARHDALRQLALTGVGRALLVPSTRAARGAPAVLARASRRATRPWWRSATGLPCTRGTSSSCPTSPRPRGLPAPAFSSSKDVNWRNDSWPYWVPPSVLVPARPPRPRARR